jgi:glycopeptide antibiotics resistance protein
MDRYTDVTDVFTGTVGVWLGARLMQYGRAESAGRCAVAVTDYKWTVVGAAYSVVLVLLFWAPFDFAFEGKHIRDKLDAFFAVPLSSALMGARFTGLTSILRKLVLFAPLGVLIAGSTERLRAYALPCAQLLLLVLAWLLALAIELGQIALPNRSATIGDVLICASGTLTGLLAANRVLRARAVSSHVVC